MWHNSSCFWNRLSVSLTSFSIWEMTGPVRTTLSLLMSPAKLTPASGIKGFHRDMSNTLHATAVCIRRFNAGLLKLENVAQLLQCEGWNEGQACGNACDFEKEGIWQKERWENKTGGEEGRKREEEEEQRHTLSVNVIGCFVFQCHPQIQM